MTHITDDGVLVIAPEEDQECELCGKQAETRPYGPDYKEICIECGKLDPEGTQQRFYEQTEKARALRVGNAEVELPK